MYKELTIKNIKTFEEEQKLKIAPITLLYGENSSGKTTILKALDIIHSIFRQSNRATNLLRRGIYGLHQGSRIIEETENISSRKIHFLSSKINEKPIKIEIKLNLPLNKINKNHPLYSDQIFEQNEYIEEQIMPKKGPPKKTLSRKTIGTSTYITDKMPDGSLRRMVIRDTGRGRGEEKKFQISILGSSKILKSKEKIKMAPINLSVEIKYFPKLKLSKINKLEIKNINNKTIVSYLRKDREYNFIKKDNEFGFQKGNPKENLKRMVKENPDFFTSNSGYADYKIDISKDNNIWLNLYEEYEKIFSSSKEIKERLDRTRLLFKALNRFNIFSLIDQKKDTQIKWESFSEIVSTYILSNNKKKIHELEKDLDNLFIFSKNLPTKINHKFINTLLSEQTGMELIDGDLGWEGVEPENYFIDKILSKHSNAKKYFDEIFTIMVALKSSKYKHFLIIEKFLTKKVSFKKFCSECRNSFKDHSLRFVRSPNLVGMGSIVNIEKGL
ncbi:ATP-binding protein [Candidatus Pelagibacter sp.]|nr:ATP-binding protein [Candidatus Pelagibacter sp.]